MNTFDVAAALFGSPAYATDRLCVPIASDEVEKVNEPPAGAFCVEIALPPSNSVKAPVGVMPLLVIVPVSVTKVPTLTGEAGPVRTSVGVANATTSTNGADVLVV